MPVELVAAAVLATGYKGPISLEVFNHSLNQPGDHVPDDHAARGMTGLKRLAAAATALPAFWRGREEAKEAVGVVVRRLQPRTSQL